MIFDEFKNWRDYAVNERGYTPDEAYRMWRKAYWLALHPDRTWRARHRGIKQGGRRYRDASTLTPFLAQE